MSRIAVRLAPLGFALMFLFTPALAQDMMVPNITVSGEGGIAVEPDVGVIRAGVTNQGKTAREASEANARVMTAVLTSLTESGIPASDVQTSRFVVQPILSRPQGETRNEPPRITGYQVSNTVTVKVRQINAVGAILDRLLTAGANNVLGVDFSVSDMSRPLDAARVEAVEDARRKAEIYAKAAGVQLGRIISVTETGVSVPHVAMMRAGGAAAPPISPGEEMLRVSIRAAFEIVR